MRLKSRTAYPTGGRRWGGLVVTQTKEGRCVGWGERVDSDLAGIGWRWEGGEGSGKRKQYVQRQKRWEEKWEGGWRHEPGADHEGPWKLIILRSLERLLKGLKHWMTWLVSKVTLMTKERMKCWGVSREAGRPGKKTVLQWSREADGWPRLVPACMERRFWEQKQ